MYKRLFILLMICSTASSSFAHDNFPEKPLPSKRTEIVRRDVWIDIEGRNVYNATVTLRSTDDDNQNVRVTVQDRKNRTVYEKNFRNSCLYIFEKGQVRVGKAELTQLIISECGNLWLGKIREKEGIWK